MSSMKNIYLFIGDNPASITMRINRIISEEHIDEFSITKYDCEVDSLDSALEDALTIPFMSDKKVVLIKNPIFLTKQSNVKDYSLFMQYLKKPMESTTLIINAAALTLDEKKDAVIELKKKAEIINIKKPSDVELYGVLSTICKHAGVCIKEEAQKRFFEYIGTNDIVRLRQEASKLILNVGSGGVITLDLVEMLVVKDMENDIFALTNAIIKKDRQKAYATYRDLILTTTDAVSLVNQVSSTMRNLYAVGLLLDENCSQTDIQSRLNIKSGYAYNLIKNYKSMEKERIMHAIWSLAELDYKIKSGKVEAKKGFEMFVLEI